MKMRSHLTRVIFSIGVAIAAQFEPAVAFADDARPVLFMSSAGGHRSASLGAQDYLRQGYPDQAIEELDLVQHYSAFPQGQGEEHWRYLLRILPQVITPNELSRLEARILALNPKSIVTTDFPTARALAILKEQGRITVPISWIHVDLVDNEMYRTTALGMDQSFVGSEEIRRSWIQNGISSDRITTTGFPVRSMFLDSRGNRHANMGIPTITLVGGSWGLLEFTRIVRDIDQHNERMIRVVAVAGRNTAEYQSLLALKNSGSLQHVWLEVHELIPQEELLRIVQSSEVVISKPGGATVFEMAFAGASVIYVNHMSAPHEELNMNYAISRGAAVSVPNYDGIGQTVDSILDDSAAQRRQIRAQAQWRHELDPRAISTWVTGWTSIQCRRLFED